MNSNPRVLVIAQGIPETILAGNVQLFRLFKSYPSDKLLVIGPPINPGAYQLNCQYQTWKPSLARWERSRLAKLVRTCRVAGMLPQSSVHRIASQLGAFVPEVVLTVMQSYSHFSVAYAFARYAGLPLVLIVHDVPENFDQIYKGLRTKQLVRNAEIYRYASKRLCVSPEMRDYLQSRYGVGGDVLYPCPSDEVTARPLGEARVLRREGVLTLGYAGALGYGYGYQLSEMLPALRNAGGQLRIYSAARLPTIDAECVIYRDLAPSPEETWRRIKEECDAVILPYAVSGYGHGELYRTHFPSKLSEYLSLGMPVLIVGPPYATGVKWGLRNPAATLVVTEHDPDQWQEALSTLKSSPDLREKLAKGAVRAARRDFNPFEIREQFNSTLLSVCTSDQGIHWEARSPSGP